MPSDRDRSRFPQTVPGAAPSTAFVLVVALALGSPFAAADWYVGAGGGVSRLTPDTGGSAFTLEEEGSAAVGVFGGRAFGSRYAFELGATRLGEAGLSGDESIEYSVISAGALGYVFGEPARIRRGEAAGGFLKLGLGTIDNASDVPLEQEDNLSIWAAVGVDVPFGRAWAFRAELASFDGDAQAALASVVWRPRAGATPPVLSRAPEAGSGSASGTGAGATSGRIADAVTGDASGAGTASGGDGERAAEAPTRDTTIARAESPVSRPAATPGAPTSPALPLARPAQAPAERPSSPAAAPVFDGVLDGVDFAPGTATLTAGGERALDDLAARLLASPEVTIEIRAHARAGADAAAARTLSRERAVATARRLAGQGVPVARLRARAFGAERPPSVPGVSPERIEIGTIEP